MKEPLAQVGENVDEAAAAVRDLPAAERAPAGDLVRQAHAEGFAIELAFL